MNGRRYSVAVDIDAVTASKTLMILTMPSDRIGILHRVSVTNRTQTTAEQLAVMLSRISALGTPTVSSDNDAGGNNNVTVQQMDVGDAATGATISFDVTASEPTYNGNAIDKQGVQNLAGYRWNADTFAGVVLGTSESIGVKLTAAPTNSHGITVSVEWEEIGT